MAQRYLPKADQDLRCRKQLLTSLKILLSLNLTVILSVSTRPPTQALSRRNPLLTTALTQILPAVKQANFKIIVGVWPANGVLFPIGFN